MKLYYDTESTGFKGGPSVFSPFHRMVQFCALDEEGHTFCRDINPKCRIPDSSTQLHRVCNKRASRASDFSVVWHELLETIEEWLRSQSKRRRMGFHETVYFIAHNNFRFDFILLSIECQRNNCIIPDWVCFVDTLPFFKENFPHLLLKDRRTQPFSLGNLYQHFFKKPLVGAHDAFVDVKALKQLVEQTGAPFSTENTKPKRWCADTECMMDLVFIGVSRAKAIEKIFLDLEFKEYGYKTVGDLRKYFQEYNNKVLERFLRVDLKVRDDHQVLMIISQIRKIPILQLMPLFPFLTSAFGFLNVPPECKEKLFEKKIQTTNQLKDYYYFVCKENMETFRSFLKDMGFPNIPDTVRKLYIK